MTVGNEVSSDIVEALLVVAKDKSAREMSNLTDTIIKVHSVLQELLQEEHKRVEARVARWTNHISE
jgi:hypothetical protein